MVQLETNALFSQFLFVCNQALKRHKDTFPYKQIMDVGESILGDRNIGLAVYADDPDTPFDYFTVRLHQGQLDLVAHGKQDPEIAWKVSRDYLEKVVEHPQDYIEHPEKLDLDWIVNRLGLG